MFGPLRSTTRSLANAQADCALPTAIGSLPPSANLETAKAGASGSNGYHLHCILWLKVIALLVTLSGVDMATCGAQNLVPNGSFEDYSTCPDPNFFGQWQLIEGWTSPYTPSVDYYNRCAGGVVCSVPFNTCGYQEPADGDAYIGIITYVDGAPFYRETFGCQLTEPLEPGVPVYVSYRLSPGGFGSWDGNSAQYAAKGPGINFFTVYPVDWSTYLFPNSAMVDMHGVLNDTSAWTTITGSFVPDSAYEYLVIGNFFVDSLSEVEVLDTLYGTFFCAYAFVDQVCVSYDSSHCAGWTGQMEGAVPTVNVHARPNPCVDELELSTSKGPIHQWHIDVLDGLGRHIDWLEWPVGAHKFVANTSHYPNGMLTLVFTGRGVLPSPIRLIHVSTLTH